MAVVARRSDLVVALATVAVSALAGPLRPVGVTAALELVKLLQGAWERSAPERALRDRVQQAITDWAEREQIDADVVDRGVAWAVEYVQKAGSSRDLIAEADFCPNRAAGAVLDSAQQRDARWWGTEAE